MKARSPTTSLLTATAAAGLCLVLQQGHAFIAPPRRPLTPPPSRSLAQASPPPYLSRFSSPHHHPSPVISPRLYSSTKISTGGWSIAQRLQSKFGRLLRRHQSAAQDSADGEEEEEDEDEEKYVGAVLPPIGTRPDWLPSWVPSWTVALNKRLQVLVLLVLYFLHMLVLSKVVVPFPFQVIPNEVGLFQSIGLDSLVGLLFLVGIGIFRRSSGMPLFPSIYPRARLPFHAPTVARPKVLPILIALIVAYISSGGASRKIEMLFGFETWNVAIARAVMILVGHLTWVVLGGVILGMGLQPFFGRRTRWMTSNCNTYWLWWALGGYYVSSVAFHAADTVNQLVLPASAFEADSVVTQMINPEDNNLLAMLLGSLAPCVSAPWWEEVLYRGFLLPALALFLPVSVAAPVSAIIFAAHHMSLSGMLPLGTLGYLWAVIYIMSGNLMVPMVIHAMWNSRVFLGSLLGV